MVSQIKSVNSSLPSKWFLVKSGEEVIGEFGIVFFESGSQKIGRIQDVDICPIHQGMGLGNLMLNTIINKSYILNLDSICLMADASDWQKGWYLSKGFENIGTT